MSPKLSLLLLQLTILEVSFAWRILLTVPTLSESHVMFNYRLAEALASQGHQVTVWRSEIAFTSTAIKRKTDPPKGIKELIVPDIHIPEDLQALGDRLFGNMVWMAVGDGLSSLD